MELPKGKVVTVLGPVEPCALGTVLTHEHLSDTLDDRVFVSQPQVHHAAMSACPFTLENLWWIRQFPLLRHGQLHGGHPGQIDRNDEPRIHERYHRGSRWNRLPLRRLGGAWLQLASTG
ncbi:hypothetical protein IscW_ISCW006483 [Ixodes scapularis]|uniref:Parathion hydrolase-related protein n=1 Tax=Ixodes scapularis TaxID=6945 RepID=B7PPP2_IXOSC|nr:hypothetical protein IscW_ISCW006483 [Ixodes scapularis]|eukprot:XP_002435734.1 hypothetical protein IscW_ISCW006483 [Ixodes scapularis]